MPDDSFNDYVLDQLSTLEGVTCRAMFGGHGLYQRSVFFGVLHDGRLYFKTDADSRAAYEAAGMEPFQPNAKQTLKSYYEVPVDVLDNRNELCEWAERAVACKR